MHRSHQRQGLPISYFLVDSWWYGEREHGGVWMWEDTPTLVSDTFPGNATHPGMKRLSAELGGLPFKAHAGGWSKGKGSDKPNPYFANPDYKFVTRGNTGVPQGPGLWNHVFRVNQDSWNLRAIKQDHMNEQLGMSECTSTVNVARDWLKGMGDAALQQNFSIQCERTIFSSLCQRKGARSDSARLLAADCMTLPIITMNSASIHASTHQRLGPDYLAGSNRGNWRIGDAAVFVWGVGLLPFKDTFLSNTSQAPPTHANTGTGTGGFKGFKEEAPTLHAISSLLSAGPVSPSDGVDGANVPLLMSLCRADGKLLKPDKPARSLDAQWLGRVFNSSAPSGTLWSTSTTINNKTWGYVLSVNSAEAWSADATTLNLPGGNEASAGYSWARSPLLDPSLDSIEEFSEAAPLQLAPQPHGGKDAYSDDVFTYYSTAPKLSNGMVLLGETGKMVPVSSIRFADVDASASDSISVSLLGAAGENVAVAYLAKGSKSVAKKSCTMSADGKCTLMLK